LRAGAVIGLLASVSPAAAGNWCGFQTRTDSVVECGFSTYAECRSKVNDKDAICIPDPDSAALRLRPVRLTG
jgi:hypothetical protein